MLEGMTVGSMQMTDMGNMRDAKRRIKVFQMIS